MEFKDLWVELMDSLNLDKLEHTPRCNLGQTKLCDITSSGLPSILWLLTLGLKDEGHLHLQLDFDPHLSFIESLMDPLWLHVLMVTT